MGGQRRQPGWRRLAVPVAVGIGLIGMLVPLTPAVAPAAAAAAVTATAGTYTNPLSPLDTPDSDVVRLGRTYLAFSTGDGFDNIPVMATTDLASWPTDLLFDPDVNDALPCQTGSVGLDDCTLSAWATRSPGDGAPWAPSMIQVGAVFYLFYAAWDPGVGHYCIGVAESAAPRGPYVDRSSRPVVCQVDLGGSIDPDAYLDAAGVYHLAWKNNDGFGSSAPATLWSSRVDFTATGATLQGTTTALLRQDRPWESTIEQPDMVEIGGHWMLFFSGGAWWTSGYGIGDAYCRGPAGPCADSGAGPAFRSAGTVAGPGAPSLFTDTAGTLWMAYDAWTSGHVGYPDGARSLRLAPVCPVGSTPDLGQPTATPQPLGPDCPLSLDDGYQMVGSDGGIFSFHVPFAGSVGGQRLNAPVVAEAGDPAGGYWEVASDGGIFAFGDATFDGSMGGHHLNSPIVGMVAVPAGGGYWEVASDGGIFAFGDATFDGSMGGHHLNARIVGIATTPDGGGYWEVASDGGIFAFGDATFDGSMGGHHLNARIVGMALIGG